MEIFGGKNKKKKIGILTFHDGINHGAYLQAYALQNYLKGIGYQNKIINYKKFRFWLNEYKSFLYRKDRKDLIENIKKIIKFKKCHKKMKLTRFTFSAKNISKKKFDIIIVGSDEVWNFKNPLLTYNLTYFGENLNSKKIISYAPSFGAVNKDEKIPEEIIRHLKKFTSISVRDNNSSVIIKKLMNIDAPVVLDPTFLYDFSNEVKQCPYDDFILLYALKLTAEEIDKIKQYSKKVNKKIIAIGYKNLWSDINIINIDPFEWVGYFKKASIIITPMFHGVLFSIKFNKQFCTIMTPIRENKVGSILENLDLSDRIMQNDDSLEKLFERKIDYSVINKKIDLLIDKSKKYLTSAIE